MAGRTRPELTADQRREAEHLKAAVLEATIFGDNEFAIRDIVHRIGAKAVETALRERKKGGTTVPA